MVFDPSSYEVGQGYAEPAAPAPPAPAPAAPTPGSPAPARSSQFEHLARQHAAKSAAPADEKPVEDLARPDEQQQEQPETQQQEQAPKPPVELQVPSFVSLKEQTPERMEMVDSFSAIAPNVGIDAGTAQSLLDLAVDCATMLDYSKVVDANQDDARTQMEGLFG